MNRFSATATTKTRTYRDPRVCHQSTDPSPPVTDWRPRSKSSYIQRTIVQETGVHHVSQRSNDQSATRGGGRETVEEFLHRASMMLQRQEVKKGMYSAGGERHRMAPTKQATWGHGTDPMKLDMMQTTNKRKESRKCFQYEKAGHIRCNCHSAREGNTLASLELGSGQGLGMEGVWAKED